MRTSPTLLALVLGLSLSSATELVPFEFHYPKPMWVGKSVSFNKTKEPHLAASIHKGPAQILAPAAATNLALDAEVTASAEPLAGGDLQRLTDGDFAGEREDIVALPGGLQWVQIDFGQRSDVFGLIIWHHFFKHSIYDDVIIQLSDDPEFKAGVTTVWNSDHDATAGLPVGAGTDPVIRAYNAGITIPLEKPVRARYLRAYATGDHFDGRNLYNQIMAVGTPAP